MRDAYDTLFKHIDKELFFRNSLEDIIYIENDKIDSQWLDLKYDIFNNQTIYIRGYGRDAQKTKYFLTLYKYLFENENVNKDSTNNAQPSKLIKCNTNYCKVIKENKNEKLAIRNYQISHLFGRTKNPLLFNCAWNIAYIPKYLDPFTGHETQGNYSSEFKNIILPILKEKFEVYIKDYNAILESKILDQIDRSLISVKKELRINKSEFTRFEKNVRAELSLI